MSYPMKSTPDRIPLPAGVETSASEIYRMLAGEAPGRKLTSHYRRCPANPEQALQRLEAIGLGQPLMDTYMLLGESPVGKDLIFLAIAKAQWCANGGSQDDQRTLDVVLSSLRGHARGISYINSFHPGGLRIRI